MNQEETTENRAGENEAENKEEIENLPIESINSYARIEEVMTDEDSEEGSNPTAES